MLNTATISCNDFGQEAYCMKGRIQTTKYGFRVRFGRRLSKHFKSLHQAERFLNALRYETDQGTFDPRDYRSDRPLSFSKLSAKYLELKKQTLKPNSYRRVEVYLYRAVDAWGDVNVKTVSFGMIEDFLFGQECSEKTRANIASCLHAFFTWASRREGVPMPEFPRIDFELGWRPIIDIATQQAIIEEIRRMTWDTDPKIHFAFKCLSTYINIRPGELIALKERQIDLKLKAIVIPSPKEKRPKLAYLLDEDVEFLASLPRGLPDLYFFRHRSPGQGRVVGKQWGKNYLYKLWKKACRNLGIEGIDLYGGCRHSTATNLAKFATPEEVRDATGHASAAFERYCMTTQGRAIRVTEKIRKQSCQHSAAENGGGETGKLLKFKE